MSYEKESLAPEQVHEATHGDAGLAAHVAWAEKTHVEDQIALDRMIEKSRQDLTEEHDKLVNGGVEDPYQAMSNALLEKGLGLTRAINESRTAGFRRLSSIGVIL